LFFCELSRERENSRCPLQTDKGAGVVTNFAKNLGKRGRVLVRAHETRPASRVEGKCPSLFQGQKKEMEERDSPTTVCREEGIRGRTPHGDMRGGENKEKSASEKKEKREEERKKCLKKKKTKMKKPKNSKKKGKKLKKTMKKWKKTLFHRHSLKEGDASVPAVITGKTRDRAVLCVNATATGEGGQPALPSVPNFRKRDKTKRVSRLHSPPSTDEKEGSAAAPDSCGSPVGMR